MNPAAVIFPLPPLSISSFDRLFLTEKQWITILNFQHAASNFNAMLDAVNNSTNAKPDIRYKLITSLHVDGIGSWGTGGLFDAFVTLENTIPKVKKLKVK